ncbi:MAG: hypothetical protein ABIH82_00565 [Candidatus Woesearchaeota archaeon]
MVKKLTLLFALFLLVLPIFVSAGNCGYYFYGTGCVDCEESQNAINQIITKNPDIVIEKYEVYFNKENGDLLKQYFVAYNLPESSQGLPALFLPQSYLIGNKPIKDLAGESILNSDDGCPSLNPGKTVGIVGDHFPFDVIKILSFFTVTAGAMSDAFHPGMLALLLILILFLTSIRDERKIVQTGIQFIIGVYLAYLLFSLGMFTFLASSQISVFFYRFVGLVSVVYGFITVKNFLVKSKFLKFSEKNQEKIALFLEKFSANYGVLIVSMFLSLFSFAKVDNVLLSLRYAFRSSSGWMALPISLYYLLIMVLPLIVVLILIIFIKQKHHNKAVKKKEKVDLWKEHYHNTSRVIISLICVILGLIVLFI